VYVPPVHDTGTGRQIATTGSPFLHNRHDIDVDFSIDFCELQNCFL